MVETTAERTRASPARSPIPGRKAADWGGMPASRKMRNIRAAIERGELDRYVGGAALAGMAVNDGGGFAPARHLAPEHANELKITVLESQRFGLAQTSLPQQIDRECKATTTEGAQGV